MKCLLILFTALCPMLVFAQDYQPIASNHVRFYDRGEPEDFDEYGLRVDSVVTDGTDSIYYNYLASRDYDGSNWNGGCDFKRYSWVGSSVVLKPNGWSFFVTEREDTLKINHAAQINDTWVALNVSTDSIIWATVTNNSNQSVLGLNDNVKVISFVMKDENNTTIQHPINGSSIRIGEMLGLIKSVDLYHFPSFIESSFHDNITLSGAEDLGIGLRRPKRELLFAEFEVGDEFAYRYRVGYHDPFTPNAEVYDTLVQIIDKQSQPSLSYTVLKYSSSRTYQVDPMTGPYYATQYASDTYSYSNHTLYPFYDDSICERMPFEMFDFLYDPSFNTVYEVAGDTLSFQVYSTQFGDIQPNGCIPDYFFEYLPWNVDYAEHLGAVWGQTSNAYDDTSYQLYYMKRGANVWGSPTTVSQILDVASLNEDSPQIYPNPIKRGTTLNLGDYYNRVDVMDITGKQVFTDQNRDVLETGNLTPGIYLIKITAEAGSAVKKLVVTD